jgi:hypothetical protein
LIRRFAKTETDVEDWLLYILHKNRKKKRKRKLYEAESYLQQLPSIACMCVYCPISSPGISRKPKTEAHIIMPQKNCHKLLYWPKTSYPAQHQYPSQESMAQDRSRFNLTT